MTRKLIRLAIASACFTPIGALPLGLGPIQVYSSLNQALDAQIELLSPEANSELRDLSVKLASPQAFEQVGIDRPILLSDLGFSVQTRSDGRNIIKITSRRPIREPSLNFLIELDGPAGRLIREYAILLDPPEFREHASVPSYIQPVRSVPPKTNDIPEPIPPVPAPKAIYDSKTYGPVAPGENLWHIANRVRPDSISHDQMMQALLKANPHAFLESNIDNLMAGVILRIPTAEQIVASDATIPQRTNPQRIAETIQPSDAAAQAIEQSAPESPQVRLLVPEDMGEQEQTASEISRAEISPQAEAASVPAIAAPFGIRLASNGIKLRLAKLDDLQARISALRAVDQAASTGVQTVEETSSSTPQEMLASAIEKARQVEAEPASESVDEPANPIPSVPSAEQTSPPIEVEESESSSEVQEPISARKSGFADILSIITNHPQTLTLAGFGSLLFIALVALLVRRNRGSESSEDEDEADVSLSTVQDDAPATATTMEGAVVSVPPLPQAEVRADQSSTAVDHLERVDLLIAIGNLREAENIVRLALAEDPTNTTLTAKLLDIQFAKGNAEGFREEAERLRDMMEDTADPLWHYVVQMGRKLCPDDSLFGGTSGSSQSASEVENATPAVPMDSEDLDLEQEMAQLYSQGQTQYAGQESPTSEATDFDATSSETDEEVAPTAKPVDSSVEIGHDTVAESFDLDWQSPVSESSVAEHGQLESEEDLEDRLQELDFDLEELPDHEQSTQGRSNEEGDDFETDIQTLDFDLGQAAEQGQSTSEETDSTASVKEGEFADEDYVDTKLDLALAYLDMEDPVGARTLLEEVLQEGNGHQKQRAEELMQRLKFKEETGKEMNIKAG